MSTGLDCWIEQRDDGWYLGIEDPASHRLDPDYNVEGPFATVEELARAYGRHPNPGGYSVTCDDYEAFERQFDAALVLTRGF